MRIIGYARSYGDGVNLATEKHPGRHYSVQHHGQGWQGHKWCVMVRLP